MPAAEIAVSTRESAAAPERRPNPVPDVWETWVGRARGGDTQAFGRLIDHFGPRVLSYLLRMTAHPQDAEDLTQDTFVKAFRMLPSVSAPRAFPAWLFTIARRTALNHFRNRQPSEPLALEIPSESPDPGLAVEALDAWRHLWGLARRHLKPDQFEVLWLRYGEQLSVCDIAPVTNRTEIHVRVLLHRGRRRLLRIAGEHGLHRAHAL